MFKWIFIILVIFLGIWLSHKDIIPLKYRHTSTGKVINTALLPLEYKVAGLLSNNKYEIPGMVEIDAARVGSLVDSINNSNRDAVIFFYDHKCFFCRHLLYDINELAGTHKDSKVVFLLIAFDEDKDKLQYLLHDVGQLNFRPIIVKPVYMTDVAYSLVKYDIAMNREPPVIMYKNSAGRRFENLPVDFGTKKLLVARIGAK